AGRSTSAPSRTTNAALRIGGLPAPAAATQGLEQPVVIVGPPDRDAHAVLEQRIVERADQNAGAPRRLPEERAVARAHEHEVRVARIDLDDLRHVEQRLGEALALALEQRDALLRDA